MLENTGQKIVSSVFQHQSVIKSTCMCVTFLTHKTSFYVKIILKSKCNLTKIGQFEKVFFLST